MRRLAWAALVIATSAAARPTATPPGPSTATTLAAQLDAQASSVERARSQVLAKQHDRQHDRIERARLAYKLLRTAGSPLSVAPNQRLAIARSRATARLLLTRDRAEVMQLANEVDSLTTAAVRIGADRARVGEPPPDLRLLQPVAGTIARRFGTIEHDDSHATLSRRGIDFDTDRDAFVIAPADGIVRYAGPIRGLDAGLVIDHGGVWTVIAKLAPTDLAIGSFVAAGQKLGHPRRWRVYFEVRVPVGPGGLPIDPAPYLIHP
jgi:murein hydrolase activator